MSGMPSARVRYTTAVILLAPVGALFSWFAFVRARGTPGTCGGDYPPCPPGDLASITGVAVALFVLVPLAVVLAWKEHPELLPTSIAAALGGIAAGVFTSRFVADPITDRTAPTWWWVGITAGLATVAVAVAYVVVQFRGANATDPDSP